MIDDRAVLLARIEALEKENAALLLLLEKQGIAYDGDRGLKKSSPATRHFGRRRLAPSYMRWMTSPPRSSSWRT